LGSCLSAVQQNDFNKFYRAKTPRTQRKKYRPNFSELGVLCGFARDTVFPISFIRDMQGTLSKQKRPVKRRMALCQKVWFRGENLPA
jgi:hypothetical protein